MYPLISGCIFFSKFNFLKKDTTSMKSSINYLSVLFISSILIVKAQEKKAFRIHSHNDYHQNIPFWNAFSNGLTSIEVDVFLENDSLFVTHGKSEIVRDRTIENLYLQPIQKVIDLKLGALDKLQLLVDFKSEAYPTLNKLIATLQKYPVIINDPRISIVISGNRPKPEEYKIIRPTFISITKVWRRLQRMNSGKK